VLAGLGVLIFSYGCPPSPTGDLVSRRMTGLRHAGGTVVAGDHPGLLHLGPGHENHTSGDARVLQQDYIRTARAKGLKSTVVTVRHALRNALIPVISILGPLSSASSPQRDHREHLRDPGVGEAVCREHPQCRLQHHSGSVYGLRSPHRRRNLIVDLLYTVVDQGFATDAT